MADKDHEKRLIQIEKSLKKLEERLAKLEKSGKKAAKATAETARDKLAELERAIRSNKPKSADS
jgi:septation ring formation regulator EzrA